MTLRHPLFFKDGLHVAKEVVVGHHERILVVHFAEHIENQGLGLVGQGRVPVAALVEFGVFVEAVEVEGPPGV